MTKIGFIGAGNMGTAIMKGISRSCFAKEISLFAADSDALKLEALKQSGVSPSTNIELTKQCDYIVLAVKPQVIDAVLEEIAPEVTEDKILISIAAGISDEYISKKTIRGKKIILVMPNTPLLLGEGATALSRTDAVTDEEFKCVCDIFASCGKIAAISKDKMKEVIAINGSSPAFIYLFAKGFIEYGEKVGIGAETAKELFCQSLIGSAKMITDSGYTVDELIKMVSSPGGTTLKGLDELYAGNLTKIVGQACESCTNRAYELSKK